MGYPVTYRTEAARAARRASPGYQGANDNKPGTVQKLPTKSGSGMPKYNLLPHGQVRPPSQPFGLAGRRALRARALAGFKGGLNLRGQIFGGMARWALRQLIAAARNAGRTSNPGTAKHSGWTTGGRMGLYPFSSGKTSAHTTGAYIGHNFPPLVFNHPWGGVPFNWAEYDSVDRIENPITHAVTYHFTQVGSVDQGTGPNPAAFYAGLKDPPFNPWKSPYNPHWNRVPGRWPQRVPKPALRPEPSIPGDPFTDPPGNPYPDNPPQPLPYPTIPHTKPNPYRSPNEQTQRGPFRVPMPKRRPDLRPPPTRDPWTPELPEIRPPIYRPKVRYDFRDGKAPRVSPDHTRDKRPPMGKKEGKIGARTKAAADLILSVVNGVSEFSDFLRALHKALPAKYQRPGKLVMDQWKDVYEHWDEVDIPHALRSIARDQLEDMIYGKMGKISGRSAHRRGQLYDPAGRAMRKLQPVNGYDPIDDLLDRIFGKDT